MKQTNTALARLPKRYSILFRASGNTSDSDDIHFKIRVLKYCQNPSNFLVGVKRPHVQVKNSPFLSPLLPITMQFPIRDELFSHLGEARKTFQSSAELQYQDIKAVQDNGIAFDLFGAVSLLDVGFAKYSSEN